ncbi:V-type proton ATPase subunit S1-like [Drosophila innubila]|uniref:V-type proton ATPase subunit S1-like n=1 Tax=Drosophila innubila TaxID=198719 RepID=UPI00148CE1DF|nr:V-type proton ATPase subunit S1-like [Drosophila innubila]
MTTLVGAELPITPPAFIWGVDLPKPPSIFEFVNTKMLFDMLRPLQEEHMIIVYFASELTAKDFSCLEPNCFEFLRQVKPFNFYSQVHRPLLALQRMSEGSVIWEERETLLQLPCQRNKIHAYNFTDRDLQDHDQLMKAVSNSLALCPLLQIYTAHSEEIWAMKRRHDRFYLKGSRRQLAREAPNNPAALPTVLRHTTGLISIGKIVLAEEVKRGLIVNYKRSEVIIVDEAPLRLNFVDDTNIRNGFVLTISTSMGPLYIEVLPTMGNWRISRIVFIGNVTFIPRDLLFYSQKFSLCCRCFTTYSELGARLSLYMFHMDVVFNKYYSALDPDYVPKECWLCEQFLTPGLTQGIFSAFILLLILAIGTSMLLSIGRNKRFSSANEPELYVKGYAER